MLIPGDAKGTLPRVWNSPGIVKLLLPLARTGGLIINPVNVVLYVPAYRSRLLVVEILLTVMEVEFRKSSSGVIVPAGWRFMTSWKNRFLMLFTCASRLLT